MLSRGEANESWPAQQLAEFLAVFSDHGDPVQATRTGVERVAETLDAEVVAVVRAGCPIVSIGFAAGAVPEAELRRLARDSARWCELPPLGHCAVAREPVDDRQTAWLLLLRRGRSLTGEEEDLLRGMARVLGLVREMVMRRLLIERISGIQRQIARRSPASEVLAAVAAGAAELTGSDVAVMRRLDPDETGRTPLVASYGLEGESEEWFTEAAQQSVKAAMGAPVREQEEVVGSLVVATFAPGRSYTPAEQGALETFAEHASMALTDAQLVQDAVYRSLHDPLTGLANRALLLEQLGEASLRAQRGEDHSAVLFVDIDRFKTVNDSLGHGLGDQLLIAAAKRLQACVRPCDTAARLGGDEFAVLALGADEPMGRRIADRVLKAFTEPFAVGRRAIHLGASVGVAMVDGTDRDVLGDADLAMYHAKAQGRGQRAQYRPQMRVAVTERLELESELRGAPSRGEMFLEYQPIVELGQEQVVALEALLRWEHPSRGRLEPARFVSVAEEIGEMPQLGRWVLQTACAQAARWRQRAPGARVSVNLSPVQLFRSGLVDEVAEALRAAELDPDALILELTESVIMEDVDTATRRLHELKELGVGLAIDDFGTGYCSLQYLREFPIDHLKIASSFIADLGGPRADRSLTRGIIDLGSNFGLTVIAEGVELPEQRVHLLALGCQLGQGFLFARPCPPDVLLDLLTNPSVLNHAAWAPSA